MKIATILPVPHLGLEKDNDYHLCLAHLMDNEEYTSFFREQARAGRFVMMDNGVVETGVPLEMKELIDIAIRAEVHEVVLPDAIQNADLTLRRGALGIFKYFRYREQLKHKFNLAAVPQGATAEDWIYCVREMLAWPIETIGISRFVCDYFGSRLNALKAVPKLLESDMEIHLLGCPGDPKEMAEIEDAFPGRIRGVDSGIAGMYTREKMYMGDGAPKPIVEMDFHEDRLDEDLLDRNVIWWRKRCLGEI